MEKLILFRLLILQDVYGPTATDPDIQALVVSLETASGGSASTFHFSSFSAYKNTDSLKLPSSQ